GTVIYLTTTVDEQLRRTRTARNRPLLQTADPRAVLERLAAERRPLYEEIADITIDTSGRQVRSIVTALRQELDRLEPLAKAGGGCEPAAVDPIEVSLGERSYPIHIGAGLLADAELLRRTVTGRQVGIVTNEVVAKLYLGHVQDAFGDRDTRVVVLP